MHAWYDRSEHKHLWGWVRGGSPLASLEEVPWLKCGGEDIYKEKRKEGSSRQRSVGLEPSSEYRML